MKCIIILTALFAVSYSFELLGGKHVISNPQQHKGVQSALKFGLQEISKNRQYYLGARTIVRATSQVVNGVVYEIEIEAGNTECETTGDFHELCTVPENTSSHTCRLTILSRPFGDDKFSLMKHNC